MTMCYGTTASAARAARRLRRAVVHGDAAEDVFWAGLGVLHLDIEITAVVEDAGIDELVLEFMP